MGDKGGMSSRERGERKHTERHCSRTEVTEVELRCRGEWVGWGELETG